MPLRVIPMIYFEFLRILEKIFKKGKLGNLACSGSFAATKGTPVAA